MNLKDLLTGRDNATPDLGRWSWFVSLIATLAGAVWNAVHTNAIDLMGMAQAVGVIVAAHGAALFAKKDTEPDGSEKS